MGKLRPNRSEPTRRNVILAYMLQQTHREAESRLADVRVPSLVIMGTGDVDWPEPVAEAKWIVSQLGSELVLLDGAGHHPHVECPHEVGQAVTDFMRRI